MQIHLQRTPTTTLPPGASLRTARQTVPDRLAVSFLLPGATLPATLTVCGLSPGGAPSTARRHTSKNNLLLVYTLPRFSTTSSQTIIHPDPQIQVYIYI